MVFNGKRGDEDVQGSRRVKGRRSEMEEIENGIFKGKMGEMGGL